jgi:hypothetical protein
VYVLVKEGKTHVDSRKYLWLLAHLPSIFTHFHCKVSDYSELIPGAEMVLTLTHHD